MSETESAAQAAAESSSQTANAEEITYHAVEKDGVVTAIWEMQGRKHLRTIDPRSRQGREILNLYTTADHHDENQTSAGETVLLVSERSGGSSRKIALIVSAIESPRNARLPESIS